MHRALAQKALHDIATAPRRGFDPQSCAPSAGGLQDRPLQSIA
jgi:hypothetical protein